MVNETELRSAVLGALHRVAPEADMNTLPGDVDLRDELELDSMDFLTFIEELATRTGIEVPERDYPSVRTLDSCIAYLAAHLAAPSTTA